MTPTLGALAAVARLAPPADTTSDSLVPEAVWRRGSVSGPDEQDRLRFGWSLAHTGALARAGVPILAGTDLPGNRRVPGSSLIEELRLLVRAGLSPLAALQAATTAPARYRGEALAGVIQAGAPADLLLVDADPLEDVGNLAQVHAVVVNGRVLMRPDLAELRAGVQRTLDEWGRIRRALRAAGPA